MEKKIIREAIENVIQIDDLSDESIAELENALVELENGDKSVCYKCKYDDTEMCDACKRAYRPIDNFEEVE